MLRIDSRAFEKLGQVTHYQAAILKSRWYFDELME